MLSFRFEVILEEREHSVADFGIVPYFLYGGRLEEVGWAACVFGDKKYLLVH